MAKVYWVALSSIPGIGGKTIRLLIDRFGSPEGVFDARDADLLAVPRVTTNVLTALRSVSIDTLEYEMSELEQTGIQILTWEDTDYPPGLLTITDPPPALYVRGSLQPMDARAASIVGTRQPSRQGVETAERLGRELAGRGITIVSGLALGIDAAAHRGALQAEEGRTLGVLGCGLRLVHPRSHADLARAVVNRGALVSELLPNVPPTGPNLMRRDRIVSALGLVTIVVEAQPDSGSIDTAERALRQGRRVLSVPGSPGTDRLLSRDGVQALDMDDTALNALAEWVRNARNRADTVPPAQLTFL